MSFEADITFYQFPTGQKRAAFIELDDEYRPAYLKMMATGHRFEGEVLRTGVHSATIHNVKEGEDIDIVLSQNVLTEVKKAYQDMLARNFGDDKVATS